MSLNKDLDMVLLSAWLTIKGALALLNLSLPASGTILSLLAIAAGALMLRGTLNLTNLFRPTKTLGKALLGLWLVLTGLLPLLRVSFPAEGTVMALLAVAAGLLILLGR